MVCPSIPHPMIESATKKAQCVYTYIDTPT